MRDKELRNELSAIAGDELHDVLTAWGSPSEDQALRLCRYLRSELAPYGLLSLEQGMDSDASVMRTIRRQARTVMARLT